MCLYQRHLSQDTDSDFFSLAWFSQPCGPDSSLTFSWDMTYGLAWALTGPLGPGLIIEPGQLTPMAPDDQAPVDDSVPADQVSVALTIAGRPIFARQANRPGPFSFEPTPQYWIAFGPFEPGQVLDFNEIILTTEIKFAPGQTVARAAFQRDCSWRVGR
jgi:hypothetical protein